jgi:hypothetical protein
MMGMTQVAVLLKNIGPNPNPEISKKPNQDNADLKHNIMNNPAEIFQSCPTNFGKSSWLFQTSGNFPKDVGKTPVIGAMSNCIAWLQISLEICHKVTLLLLPCTQGFDC